MTKKGLVPLVLSAASLYATPDYTTLKAIAKDIDNGGSFGAPNSTSPKTYWSQDANINSIPLDEQFLILVTEKDYDEGIVGLLQYSQTSEGSFFGSVYLDNPNTPEVDGLVSDGQIWIYDTVWDELFAADAPVSSISSGDLGSILASTSRVASKAPIVHMENKLEGVPTFVMNNLDIGAEYTIKFTSDLRNPYQNVETFIATQESKKYFGNRSLYPNGFYVLSYDDGN